MNRAVIRRSSEGGFALLLIFLMAAAIALMLYQQVPRVAFESEREKEQLLIDRGNQYKRAIQLYYVAFKRYPARIEDLEHTNDKRFLRRRYVDPYTGKDDWRLIHTNGSFLTDSLVQKPPANPAQNGQNGTQAQAGATGATTGNTASGSGNVTTNPTDPNAPPQVNAAVLRRPSDRPITPNGAFPGGAAPGVAPGDSPEPVNSGYIDPKSYPPISLFPNGYNTPSTQPGQPVAGQPGAQPGVVSPGVPQPGVLPPGIAQPGFVPPGFAQPGFVQPGAQLPVPGAVVTQQFQGQPANGGLPGGFQPGLPGQSVPGQNLPGQALNQPVNPNQYRIDPSGQMVPIYSGQNPTPQQVPNPSDSNMSFTPSPAPGAPGGFPPPPGAPATAPGNPAQQNQALNMINQLLTTPRQPPPGIGPSTNQVVGGGIAGVASTFEGPTIKVYGDRTHYNEWEFVFQPQQQGVPVPNGQNPLQTNQPGNQPQPPGAGPAPAQPR